MENEQHPDPEIARKHAIHRNCVVAVKAGILREEYIADALRIMNAIYDPPVTAEELGKLWDGYTGSAKQKRIDEDLEYNLLMEIQATEEAREWSEFFDRFLPLMEISPVETLLVDAVQYLRLVVPHGNRVVLNTQSVGRKRVWQNDVTTDIEVNHDRYWPLCVNHELNADNATLKRVADAVIAWNVATTVISANHLNALTAGITGRLFPVRDVVALGVHTLSVTFNIAAENKAEWLFQCQRLRTSLGQAGIFHSSFRYDAWAYLPHEYYGQRLVYLDP